MSVLMIVLPYFNFKKAVCVACALFLIPALSACSYFHPPELEVSSDDLDMNEVAMPTQEVDMPRLISRATDGRVTLYSLDQAYDPITGQAQDLSSDDMQSIQPVGAQAVPGSMMPEDVYRMRNNDSVYLYPLP